MSGKPFVMVWADAESEAALTRRYLSEVQPRRRRWLHGLWLRRRGWRVDEVADAVGAGRRTVERWMDWYRHEGGVDGVLAHRQGGRGQPARLRAAPQERVADEIATGRFRTAAEIRAWIADPCGVTYRPGGVTSLVGRLRCHPKVPRPLPEKADPVAQDAGKRGASTPPSPGLASPRRR